MNHRSQCSRVHALLGACLLALAPIFARAGVEQDAVAAYHDRGEFDGVVLAADGNTIRLLAACGSASSESNAPAITPQTVFPICSLTKQFTATLVLQLVDEGKLRLDSPLAEALPGFRSDAPGRAVTVRQLLNHSSGLPNLDQVLPEQDGVEGFYRLENLDFAQPLAVLQRYARGGLEFTPGERFSYNNTDYWALGAIVESLAKKPFATVLDERLLRPLGMTHSGLCSPGNPLPPGAALGKVRDPKTGGVGPGPKLRLENFWAAGAMYSTAEDLLRWSRALDEGKLLSPATQTAMFTPDPRLGFVALGSWVYRDGLPGRAEKLLLVERQGEIGAFHALSIRLPEQHGHVIVLSNLDAADLNSTYLRKGLPWELARTLIPQPGH